MPIDQVEPTLKVTMLKDATVDSVIADFLKKYPPQK